MKSFLKKVLIALILIVLLVVGFAAIKKIHIGSSGDKIGLGQIIPTNDSELRALEINYLRYAVDDSLLDYAKIEVPTINNIATSSDKDGNYLALSIFKGQPIKNKGIRAELSIDYPYKEGDTVEYSWRFRIPGDFVSDAPANRWWLFADWHVQPDTSKGETWDNFPGYSSPILIGYGNLKGKDMISLSTGIDGSKEGIIPRGLVPFTRDEWHQVRVIVKWSQKNDGEVKLYFDGSTSPTITTTGPNMVNAVQHYMKVGMYRNRDIETNNTINVKDISIAKVQ